MRMRAALIAWLLMVGVAPSWGATLVKQQTCSVFGTSNDCVITGGVGAGNYLVMGVSSRSAVATNSASDPTHGAWTCPAGANITNASSGAAFCYYLGSTSTSGADLTVTVVMAGDVWSDIVFTEWSGMSGGLDQLNESTDTASPYTHGSITTTGAGVIITVATESSSGTETGNANFTTLTSASTKDFHQYWITSGAQTTTGEFTMGFSVNTTGAIISFLDSSGGGATCRGGLMLLGVGGC